MNLGVVNLVNPTSEDFTYAFAGQDVFIPAGGVLQLPEAAGYDLSYHLAQRILQAKNLPFFGKEHEDCQAELLGLKEPTYFSVKSATKKNVATATGTKARVELELDQKNLVEVEEAPEVNIPENNLDEKNTDNIMVGDVGLGSTADVVPSNAAKNVKGLKVPEKVIEQEIVMD